MASPGTIELPMLENPDGHSRQLGSLILSRGEEKISLPLQQVEINARVVNQVAEVNLKQVFKNTIQEHLEAVYIFPLAAASAVTSFNLRVGDRVIRGLVQERAEARQQYAQAIEAGKRAALLEQERDDVFTVSLGNLPPGEELTVELCYCERLPFFDEGKTEIRLPLVTAPRYIPGKAATRDSVGDGIEADTDIVPDASRISPPRLAKGIDPGVALKLKVEILQEKGVQISDLACSQHASKTSLCQEYITVSLARADERLNRDFVLRWRVASGTVRTSLLSFKAENGETYALLSLIPAKRDGYLGAPRDVVFVLDRSGSMGGIKMTSAVRACSILINTLGGQDRFAVAAFDNVVEWMPAVGGSKFQNADLGGIESGEKHLRSISARGGTEMDPALASALEALKSRTEKNGRLASIVLLTDGEVGNESQILRRIQNEIADARLFVVGIDTAVNSGLLKRLANLGGGTASFVEPGVQLEEALASIAREIGAPVVSDLQLENLDLTVDQGSLSPKRIPDLFAGRASVSFFKLKGSGSLRVKGRNENGGSFLEELQAQEVDMPCIAQLWAKSHIVDLEDEYRIDSGRAKPDLKKQIIEISTAHQILTKFTAFVVVDESEIVNKTGNIRKVVQAVEMPDMWELDECMQTGAFRSMSAPAAAAAGSMKHLRKAKLCQSPPAAGLSAPQSSAFDSVDSGWGDIGAKSTGAISQESGGWGGNLSSSPPANDAWGAAPQASPQPAPKASPAQQRPVLKDQKSIGAQEPIRSKSTAPQAAEIKAEQVSRDEDLASVLPVPPQGLAGLFSKLSSFVAGKDKKGLKADSRKEEIRSEFNSIQKQIAEFLSQFEQAFEKLSRSEMPDADRLESSRLDLIQALLPCSIGMELPLLQRFLRAGAIELIGSLHDKSLTLAELALFWGNKKGLYDASKAELENLLIAEGQGAFWDASV